MGMRLVPARALHHMGYMSTERVAVQHYEGNGYFNVRDASGLTFGVHRDMLTFLPGAKVAVWDGVHDDDESV